MVRETTTLGQGQAPNTRPQEMPTVRNVAVYESTRMIDNWELAFVSEKTADHGSRVHFIHRLQAYFGRESYNTMDNKHSKAGQSEVFYRSLLVWKKRQELGHAQIGVLAKLLRDCYMNDIAEQLEP